MVTILKPRPSFGEEFGTSLSNALGQLASDISAQREQQKRSQLLEQLLGGQSGQEPSTQLSGGQLLQAGKLAGLNPQELSILQRDQSQRQKAELQKKQLELQEEKTAIGESKDYLNALRQRVEPAQDLYETVKETQELLAKPNLQIGTIKSLVPSRLQNSDTQQLVAKLNEIVTKKAQLGRGVPSKQRLLLEQLSKPQVWQRPQTIKKLVSNLENQLNKTLQEEVIKDQIIEEHGATPRNLESLVKRRLKSTEGLPNPNEFTEDAIIEINGKQFEKVGQTWRPIGK